MDKIAELNRDASAALATIREWMNSLVPINRLPLDVLSLPRRIDFTPLLSAVVGVESSFNTLDCGPS